MCDWWIGCTIGMSLLAPALADSPMFAPLVVSAEERRACPLPDTPTTVQDVTSDCSRLSFYCRCALCSPLRYVETTST
eukprot:1187778-Prorocentrum_minimum.AAC.2